MKRWTPRIAAAQTRQQIKALRADAKARMERIAYLWMDQNGYLERLPDEILAKLDFMLREIEEHVDDVLQEQSGTGADR